MTANLGLAKFSTAKSMCLCERGGEVNKKNANYLPYIRLKHLAMMWQKRQKLNLLIWIYC